MFKKILIANRGEIALRVVRACKDLGVTSCIAYSTADRLTAAVEEADERVCIGPAPSALSYLDMQRLIGAAVSRGCEAVHPGYGFLSENAEFARKCLENGLTFIGPDPDVIDRMGEKSNAKQTMKAAGVPTVPGSDGAVETVEEAAKFAEKVPISRNLLQSSIVMQALWVASSGTHTTFAPHSATIWAASGSCQMLDSLQGLQLVILLPPPITTICSIFSTMSGAIRSARPRLVSGPTGIKVTFSFALRR